MARKSSVLKEKKLTKEEKLKMLEEVEETAGLDVPTFECVFCNEKFKFSEIITTGNGESICKDCYDYAKKNLKMHRAQVTPSAWMPGTGANPNYTGANPNYIVYPSTTTGGTGGTGPSITISDPDLGINRSMYPAIGDPVDDEKTERTNLLDRLRSIL